MCAVGTLCEMLQASERCVREYRFEVDVPGADGHEGAICR